MMTGIAEDFQCAARTLRRSPGFALAAVGTLGLGIGVNAAVFTLSNAVLFSGFPYVDGNERIVYVASSTSSCCLSYPDFEDWREQAASFDELAVVHGTRVGVSDGSALPESHDATRISAGTFGLVGRSPLVGRDFTAADEAPGAEPVAILSHDFWARRYASDPDIVGRVMRVDGMPTTVIGVMPPGFSFPQKQALWLPLMPTPEERQRDARNLWFAFGRLAAGATLERAGAEMDAIGRRLADRYPLTNRDYMPGVRTFNEFFVGPNENTVYATMWGAVAFVLLIACANLANLTLARAVGRSREIAVRIALGAGRWRIARQLLVETLTLSALGAVAGWWLAKWAVHAYALAERGPGRTPWRILDYTMDYEVLAYVTAVTIGAAVVSGLAPAGRLSKVDVTAALKDGERGTSGGASGKRLSAALVAAEVALAVVLLAGAGLMVRSYLAITTTNTGIETENVLTAFVELPPARYPSAADHAAFWDRLENAVESLPGVGSAAFASALPTSGAGRAGYELADLPVLDERQRPTTSSLVVSPDYFGTLGASVLAGRALLDTDDGAGLPVALVNELLANRHWPGEDAIGKRLRLFDDGAPGTWLTVVGIVPNIVQSDATRQTFEPVVYLAHRQSPRAGLWILARTRVPPAGLAEELRRVIQALDADLPVFLGPYPLEQRMAETYWNSELYAVLFLAFAAIALLLAAGGLYAIVAYSVSRSTQEIGVRIAVGANARHILGLVFRQGMLPLALGLAIGLVVSLGVTQLLKSLLVGVSPADPVAFGAATAVLVSFAALGCWIPARRALRVDPVVALKHH